MIIEEEEQLELFKNSKFKAITTADDKRIDGSFFVAPIAGDSFICDLRTGEMYNVRFLRSVCLEKPENAQKLWDSTEKILVEQLKLRKMADKKTEDMG